MNRRISKYFILGQLEALDYIEANTKPRRMDLKNTYIKTILAIKWEKQRLNRMLDNKALRFNCF